MTVKLGEKGRRRRDKHRNRYISSRVEDKETSACAFKGYRYRRGEEKRDVTCFQ
jgi:hypothetical protein